MSVSFLYALLVTTSSPLTLQTQSWVYATSSVQENNNQEKAYASSENENVPDKANSESQSSKGTTFSDQSKINQNRNDDNDASSTNQNSNCPNIPEISNLPLYIGQVGCQYPCPSLGINNQDSIPEGCPIEPSTSQTNTGFSLKEENPTQSPSQEQQQVKQPQQQQNSQESPIQNAFVNPSINSDTGAAISNSESPTNTQKSFTPAGKLRSGTSQTDSSIPSLSNDPSKPKPSDSGNVGVEGTPLTPPSQTEFNIPGKTNDISGPLKPGSGQMQTSIPSLSNDPSRPFTLGGGNPQVEGIPNQPNTDSKTPFEPGKIDTDILTPGKHFDPADTFKTGKNLTSLETSTLSKCASDITGKWNGNDGGNYYLRQIGNEIWWFGSNIFKANGEFNTFSNVFSGIKKGLTVDGDWQDVPLGDTNSKGKISLIIDPNGEKMTKKSATGGFGGTEWTKTCPKVFEKIKPNLPITTDIVK